MLGMKGKRFARLRLVVVGLWLLCASEASAGRIYLLLAADTSERGRIALSTGPDLQFMHDAFYGNVPGRQLVVYGSEIYDEMTGDGPGTYDIENPWKGPDIRGDLSDMKNKLLTAIANCPAGAADTVVFFYSGHGAHDSNGHYLLMPDGTTTLSRQTIIRELQKKQPRLIVLITDSCNTLVPRGPVPPPVMRIVPPERISPLFEALFVRPSGVVDVNSSTEDQIAAGPIGGGLLVLALTCMGNKPTFAAAVEEGRLIAPGPTSEPGEIRPVDFDRIIMERFGGLGQGAGAGFDPEAPPYGYLWANAGQPAGWEDVKTAVTGKMDALFRELYPDGKDVHGTLQRTQTPRFYSMPESGPAPPQRVLGLTRGDVILSINGRPISRLKDAVDAISGAGPTMEFAVRDVRDGTVWRMRTALRPTSSRFGAYLTDNPGGGALVTGVMPGYPCTKNRVLGEVGNPAENAPDEDTSWSAPNYRPEPGDRITEVNGRGIRRTADFHDAVKASPAELTFRLVDHRTGAEHLMRTRLNPVTAQSRLGIGVRDDGSPGVRVEYVREGSPGARCQLSR